MDITQILSAFAHDRQVAIVLTLILVDFLLGCGSAVKANTFRLTYVANFARNDLLGKVFPWFAIFALDKASGAADIVGPVDWSQANTVAFGVVSVALSGSILKSLADFGVTLPTALAGQSPRP